MSPTKRQRVGLVLAILLHLWDLVGMVSVIILVREKRIPGPPEHLLFTPMKAIAVLIIIVGLASAALAARGNIPALRIAAATLALPALLYLPSSLIHHYEIMIVHGVSLVEVAPMIVIRGLGLFLTVLAIGLMLLGGTRVPDLEATDSVL